MHTFALVKTRKPITTITVVADSEATSERAAGVAAHVLLCRCLKMKDTQPLHNQWETFFLVFNLQKRRKRWKREKNYKYMGGMEVVFPVPVGPTIGRTR